MPGHTTNNYKTFKNVVQYLIDYEKVNDFEKIPNVKTNPLLNYRTMPLPSTNTISSSLPKAFIKPLIQSI